MKILIKPILLAAALIIICGKLLAQVPIISYANSPASILRAVAVGTAPNPTLTITNTGGAIPTSIFTSTNIAGIAIGTAGSANGTGTAASFNGPNGITRASSGIFYVADQTNHMIRAVTAAGVVTTLAGTTTSGTTNANGTSARFNTPKGVSTDNTYVYVADYGNNQIRRVTIASPFATILIAGNSTSGTTNNATGTNARFNGPASIAFYSSALYICDYNNNQIRRVSTGSPYATTLLAGDAAGTAGMTNNTGSLASFDHPSGIASDGSGNLYVADTDNNQIRKIVISTGVVTLFAGSTAGTAGSANGNGTSATFNAPTGIAVSASGLIFVYDSGTNLVRQITAAGDVTTIAGNGAGNVNGYGINAQFRGAGLVTDASNNIFMGDFGNNSIRKLTASNSFTISTTVPAGLSFSGTTGAITGTATTSTAITNYTVTAYNYHGSHATALSLNTYLNYDWDGSSSAAWATAANWTPATIPGSNDRATIGAIAYTNAPTVSSNTTVGSLAFGTTVASPQLTISASNRTLTVNKGIVALANSNGTITGLGTVALAASSISTLSDGAKLNLSSSAKLNNAGTFTMAPTSILNVGGTAIVTNTNSFTLKSDDTGSATIGPVTGSLVGNYNVERYITGDQVYSRGYRLISSPVSVSNAIVVWPNLSYIHSKMYTTGTSGATNGFDAVGNPTMYLYRENMAPDYTSFISGNNRGIAKINNGTIYNFNVDGDAGTFTIPAGNGLLLFFRGDRATTVSPTNTSTIAKPTTLTATGYLNQGSITVKHWTTGTNGLLYTGGSPVSVRGFNLLGNPYASSIDWDLMTGTTNVGTTIWVYNPTLKVFSTYIRGNGGVGTNTNGGNVADIIPSGQGFYVKTNNTSPSVTFLETHKVSTQVTAANIMLAAAPPTTDLKYLRVKLTQDADNKDDALIFFKPGTSSDYTVDEDADYLRGNNVVAISTRVNNRGALAINQMPLPAYKENINLNVIVPVNGSYQLSVPEINDMPTNYDIWIKDWLKKDSVNIKTSPTYSFDAIATDSTTFKRRFSIVITTDPGSAYYLAEFKGQKQPAAVVLSWKTGNEGTNTQFTVERSNDDGSSYTALGSFTANKTGSYSFTDNSPLFSTENLYRLKQVDISGTVAYSGTVPISYSEYKDVTKNSIKTYPNPATSTIKLKVAERRDKNSTAKNYSDYTVTIANSQGIAIKIVNTSQPDTWESDISKFASGVYFIKVYNNNTKTLVGNSKFVKL